jgi:serine/threonine protein kinase
MCSSTVSADALFCPYDGTPNGDGLLAEQRHKITNYELIRLRGAGGMGAVFEAKHLVLGKTVAVKMLHGHLLNERLIMRFQQEAKATSRLDHPNIIRVSDCGAASGGEPYMVMDLIEGPSLKDVLLENGSLPIKESLEIVLQICEGMACAHEHKILHRDLKPGNVLLEKKGDRYEVKIADFGIAKLIGEESANQLTRTGEVCGSPQYMSPEQVTSRPVDARSDVYSIGCILFELLTGAPPFSGTTVIETMYKHVNQPIPTLAEGSLGKRFPAALESLVAKLLAKEPAERYSSAATSANAVRDLLSSIEQDAPKRAQSELPPNVDKGFRSVNKKLIVSALVTLCVGVSAVVYLTHHTGNTVLEQTSNQTSTNLTGGSVAERTQINKQENGEKQSENTHKSAVTDANIVPFGDLMDRGAIISEGTNQVIDYHGIQLTDSIASHFRDRKDIITLILRGNKPLTDKSVDYFAHLPLVQLDISDTGIGDRGVSKIATQIRKLQILNLSFLQITDQAIESLAKLHDLKSLILDSDRKLSGNSLVYLGNLSSLTTLTLRALKLDTATPDQWNSLAKLKNLQSLNIESMPLNESIASALPKLKGLKDLVLRDTKADDTLVQQLSLLDLDSIDLSHTAVTDRAMRFFTREKHLTKLELAGLRRGTANGLLELKSLPELTILNLESSSLSTEDIQQIAKLKKLEYLLLNNTNGNYQRNLITDASVKDLSELHQLKSLGLGYTDITNKSVAILQNLKLEELGLQGTHVTDEALEELAKMPSLRKLNIEHCERLSPDAIQKFKNDLRKCVVSASK